jgi:hypothetical protein
MPDIKKRIKKILSPWLYRKQISPQAFKQLAADLTYSRPPLTPSYAQANLFTYHGEDGIIQYIIQHLKDIPPIFVDIGAGDCIKGNCSTLAVHNKWNGLFIDSDQENLEIGRRFYKKVRKENYDELKFISEYVTPENVNKLIENAGIRGSVGLLSIDIDGNDFWIWKAIDIIDPKIVVIEAKVEFGDRSIVVPYSEKNNRNIDLQYNGASVEALKRLGNLKGYKLIAANQQGYNLFFIKSEYFSEPFKEWDTNSILQDKDTIASFYNEDFFNQHQFIKIE